MNACTPLSSALFHSLLDYGVNLKTIEKDGANSGGNALRQRPVVVHQIPLVVQNKKKSKIVSSIFLFDTL